MSLVNDMLRDLDKRKRLPPQAIRVNGVMEKQQVPARIASPWIAGIASLSVLAGLVGGYFMFRETPAVVTTASMAVSDEADTVSGSIVRTDAAPPAPPNVMNIVREAESPEGFLLRISTREAVQYNIVSRDTYGITLHLQGVEHYANSAAELIGMSVLLESAGANIDIDLDAATDFKVFEDVETPEFDIVLQASYRQVATAAPAAATIDQAFSQTAPPVAQPAPPTPPATAAAPGNDQTSQSTAATAASNAAVRVTREMTLEQRDAVANRSAIELMQGGQLQEARRNLQDFIAANSEAHQSRATLATLLLAQQDIAQADDVVSEGLTMAPNFAPYKKIKARILLQQSRAQDALALMRDVPPRVADDTEYHEILASLYQQNGQHLPAITTYQELLRHDGRQGRWWMGMAVSLEAQGRRQDALNSFQAAVQSGNLDASLRQYSQGRIRSLGDAVR